MLQTLEIRLNEFVWLQKGNKEHTYITHPICNLITNAGTALKTHYPGNYIVPLHLIFLFKWGTNNHIVENTKKFYILCLKWSSQSTVLSWSPISVRPITPKSLISLSKTLLTWIKSRVSCLGLIYHIHASFSPCCRFPRVCCWLDGKGQSWLSHSKSWSQLWLWKNWYCGLRDSPQQKREMGCLLLQP